MCAYRDIAEEKATAFAVGFKSYDNVKVRLGTFLFDSRKGPMQCKQQFDPRSNRLCFASSQMLKYAHQNDELILLSSMCFRRRISLDVEENWIFHYDSSVA